MRKNAKKAITAAVALAMTAALAATIYAADYGDPETSTVPAPAPSTTVEADTSTESVNDAINNIVISDDADADSDDEADAGEAKVVEVPVQSVENVSIKASNLQKLAETGNAVLKVSSPKADITIDSSTIKKARKIDLSMKVYGSAKRSVVDMKSKKDFGCEVKIVVKTCKMSAEALADAHVFLDGVDLGPVELNEDGLPVITATKGGKYEIK